MQTWDCVVGLETVAKENRSLFRECLPKEAQSLHPKIIEGLKSETKTVVEASAL